MDLKIDIYKNSINIVAIINPWSEGRLFSMPWVQSSDTLLVVHPDVAAKKYHERQKQIEP